MVNKIKGVFSKDDQEAFATFATYCGLAIDHARVSCLQLTIKLFTICTITQGFNPFMH